MKESQKQNKVSTGNKENESLKRRGLIIQPGAIGDMILTLPLVKLMKRQPLVGEIDMMGRLDYLSLLEGRTDVSLVIAQDAVPLHELFVDHDAYELNESGRLSSFFRNYDLIVTFLADQAGHFEHNMIHTTAMTHSAEVITLQLKPPIDDPRHCSRFVMEQYLDHFPGIELTVEDDYFDKPLISLTDQDRNRFPDVLSESRLDQTSRAVAIHPGSGGTKKCWDLECYRTLAGHLHRKGFQPIFLWGPAEQDRWKQDVYDKLCQEFTVISGKSLSEISIILSHCKGYIGNDSGITHLAAALAVPTAAIFAVTEPKHWGPLGPRSVICRTSKQDPGNHWPSVDDVMDRLEDLFV